MERESFEDEEVAKLLNKNFIAIKVDREERPDVDTIYMSVCQAMTGHGGWPLTVLMSPEKQPFFTGTYFPKHSSRDMPGLIEILEQISLLWTTEKDKLLKSGKDITKSLQTSMFEHSRGEVTAEALHDAFRYFESSFDSAFGGFGRAPKFPTPHNLSFLMRYWKMTGNPKALTMVEKTLDAMYLGGIYDHIGFGFSRYSTDRKWLVPHFEKMLYDNALLAIAYLEAFQATGHERFKKAAKEIFTYVLRDMTSSEGAFYSAEDADSEGEEGKFYVWSPQEIREILGRDAGDKFCADYEITPKGNFEGKSIPNLIETGFIANHDEIKQKLFHARKARIHPFKDDKILTSWNGLMIAALAFGARALNEPDYAAAAEKAAGFIAKNLKRSDSRLMARYRDGEAAHPAYVDDYAFLIWGLIELYQATFNMAYLREALDLNRNLMDLFWDEEHGGFFQYGTDTEVLITRPKELYDGAIPSGNSVAAVNLLRLARLTGDPALEASAKTQMTTFGGSVNEAPPAHSHFLMAAYLNLMAPIEITLVGDPEFSDTKAMKQVIDSGFKPELTLTAKTPKETKSGSGQIIPSLTEKRSIDGKATAYVCQAYACQDPVTDLNKLKEMLASQ